MRDSEEEEKEKWTKSIFEEMTESFPKLMKEVNVNIQEAQSTSSKVSSETHIETHYNQTFQY